MDVQPTAKIFDLNVRKYELLYEVVVKVDVRVTLENYS